VVITTRRLSVASFAIDHPSLGRNNNLATNVNTYLELSSEIVIAEDGGMSIVTRSA
jgi:hypothetical protein